MTTATLTRGTTTVEIPLVATGGTPLIATDIGKPEMEMQPNGELEPRHMDAKSVMETYTILGQFTDSSAYKDARRLCDLIKSNSNGGELVLNVDMDEYDSDMLVAPAAAQEEALTVVYNPGGRDWVEVDLGLTRISETREGHDQPATTPTASGGGPVTLSYRGESVEFSTDITVERSVGRPQSVVRGRPNEEHPYHIDKHKTAYDSFELSLEFSQSTVSQVNRLVSVYRRQLKRSSLTLDFNGLYGMGAFDVVPQGSGALRHTRQSGEQGTALIPKLSLRRVL